MAALHKVKIAARLRPRLDGEVVDNQIQVHHNGDSSSGSSSSSAGGSYISVTNPRDQTQIFKFPFSSCYDENSTQDEIFHNDVEPLIDVVYSGITVTVFAYGVTSSGKTHTMQGTRQQPGVIPRVIQAMFDKKDSLTEHEVTLSVSYMEIYKDEVYDLFVTRDGAPKLPVRENEVGMVFVANLSRVPIDSAEEFNQIYSQATKNRSVGSTNLNRHSSRSHAVLTVEATMVDHSNNTTLTGKINLVDLAGSENNKQTGNDSTRMAESAAINKSLSVLGQVVHALNQGASRIPYRNSKLTRILQDALGGNAVGLLICNLAPGVKFRQDTLNTLNFAVRTKNVENKPVINERDNRPQPKQHFSAPSVPPPVGKAVTGVLLPASTTGSVTIAHAPGSDTRPNRRRSGRQSLVPVSRVPRVSMGGAGSGLYQPFALSGLASGAGRRLTTIGEAPRPQASGSGLGLTAEDLDERISRAVEAEVTRRMAEKEKEWQAEQRRLVAAVEEEKKRSRTPAADMSLPSGVLTPILQKHRDLDGELKMRLQELEKKFEQGNKEAQLAELLSPVSKKKTGRAYVALARAHSEKGDLNVALELYRKAESYVPDNMKLKERILEIEWAVKNGKEYVPTPKPPRQQKKAKQKKSSRSKGKNSIGATEQGHAAGPGYDSHDFTVNEGDETGQENAAPEDASMDIAELIKSSKTLFPGASKGKSLVKADLGEFGIELTNKSPLNSSVGKRHLPDEEEEGVEDVRKSPEVHKGLALKRQKTNSSDEEGEWEPPYVPTSKGQR